MNLELNKSTGNLFVNKSEFFFDNEQFISNNIFLKKHLKVNGFDTYGFEVVFFYCFFSLNIIFKVVVFVCYFFFNLAYKFHRNI